MRALEALVERVAGLEGPVGSRRRRRWRGGVRSLRAAGAHVAAGSSSSRRRSAPRPRSARCFARPRIALEQRRTERATATRTTALDALIDGELSARRAGAHDVRMLAGEDTLGLREELPAGLTALRCLAVELAGLLCELLRSVGSERDEQSLHAAARRFAGGEPVAQEVVALGLTLRDARATAQRDGLYSMRDARGSLLFELSGGEPVVLG